MTNIISWSTVADDNTTLAPPATMNINQLDNAIRSVQAAVRGMGNDLPWYEYGVGTGTATIVYISATSFKIAADLRAQYVTGRRVRATGAVTGDIVGTITSVSYSSPDTIVVVSWDSGSLTNETLRIFVSAMTPTAAPLLSGRDLVLDTDQTTKISGATNDTIEFSYSGVVTHRFDKSNIRLISYDESNLVNPRVRLVRLSPSPEAFDSLASLDWYGYDSASTEVIYGRMWARPITLTPGATDGLLDWAVSVGGTLTRMMRLRPSVLLLGKTAADSGVTAGVEIHADGTVFASSDVDIGGTLVADGATTLGGATAVNNALTATHSATPITADFTGYTSGTVKVASFKVNGSEVASISYDGSNVSLTGAEGPFEQTLTTWATSTAYEYSHNLTAEPKHVELWYVNKNAHANFAVGEKIRAEYVQYGNNNQGPQIWKSATEVGFRLNSSGPQIIDKTTGATTTIDDTNWNLLLFARL